MSLKSQKALKKSAKIGIAWTAFVLLFAAAIGIIGRMHLGFDAAIVDKELVFINMVRKIFPALLSGLMLSAVLAASMSTADSQLLAASSAFSSDVYKPIIRKNKASDKEMLWAGRIVVLIIAIVAVLIAANPNAGTIMSLVENAWGVFGAAFGPAILLSLFWKRFNFQGAVAGIITGCAVDIAWLALTLINNANPGCFKDIPVASYISTSGIYEILPGFVAGVIACIVVSLLTKAPSKEVEELYYKAVAYVDPEDA